RLLARLRSCAISLEARCRCVNAPAAAGCRPEVAHRVVRIELRASIGHQGFDTVRIRTRSAGHWSPRHVGGMADRARQVRTFEQLYDEILRLPEGLTGEILEDGVLRVMSRPGKRHRRAALACLDALSGVNANLRGTGWWIEVEA